MDDKEKIAELEKRVEYLERQIAHLFRAHVDSWNAALWQRQAEAIAKERNWPFG